MSFTTRALRWLREKGLGAAARSKASRTLSKRRRSLFFEGLENRQLLAAFTPGNLAVYRVGDGSSPLANTGARVFIDEFTPSGALVQSIAMPHAGGDVKLIANGIAASEGMLTLSPDGTQLALTGYSSSLPAAFPLPASTTTIQRTVGVVDGSGIADLYSFAGTTISNSDIRAAIVDGSKLYITGGANGLRYVNLDTLSPNTTGNGSAQIAGSATDLRGIAIAQGQLFVSSATTAKVGKVGTGLPTSGPAAFTNLMLPGLTTPGQMYFADLSPTFGIDNASPTKGLDTVYVADEGQSALRKLAFNGTAWVSNGSIGADSDDYRGLTGAVVGSTVTLFAVRKGGSSAAGGGELVKLVDASGYNGTFLGTPTIIAAASTGGANNTAFRGVAFVPSSGAAPAEAALLGNDVEIVDGDSTPSPADHTDFGAVEVGFVQSRTYSIENHGGSELTFGDFESSDGRFAIIDYPTDPVAPGESATFTVSFSPASAGDVSATISFESNDDDESPYDFVVTGVGEANHPPSFVDSGPYSVPENSVGMTVVGSVTAIDSNAGQTLTFSALGTGTGGALFSISSFGEITVAPGANLNFEGVHVYTFGVRVTDNGSLPQYADVMVTINLSNVNEAPVFPAGPISRQLRAGSAVGTPVVGGAVFASDPDAGDSVVSYDFAAGEENGADAFAISSSGVITVRDASLVSSGGVFNLQIVAIDSFGLRSTSKTVTVTVLENRPPIFVPDDSYGFSVSENVPTDTLVGPPLTAVDIDEDFGDTVTYSIVAGNGTGDGAFKIDSLSGQIQVNEAAQLDFETKPLFVLTVHATDNLGAFGTATVSIDILNAPEPPMVPEGQQFSIVENSPGGTTIGVVQAKFDTATLPQNRRFRIAGGNGAAPGAFAIDNTGKITVNDAAQLDYESVVNRQFTLGIDVFDVSSPVFTTSRTLVIQLTNQHEGTLLSPGDLFITGVDADDHDEFTFAPLVDLAGGTEIRFTDSGWLAAGGFRAGEGVIVYVAPAGGIAAGAELGITKNATTGAVSMSHGAGNVFEERAGSAFSLGVSGDSLTAFQGVFESPTPLYAVTLHRDHFDSGAANESTTALPIGLTMGVTAVAVGSSSTDVDNAEYAALSNGSPATLLAAVANSSHWSKSDSRLGFSYQNFSFHSPPTDIDLSGASIAENEPSGAEIGVLSTVDPDLSDSFIYSLVAGDGSEDNASFFIDGAVLKASGPFDFESKSAYAIRVRSTDSTGLFIEKQFTINISNDNDAPTGIELQGNPISDNLPVGAVVGTFSTIDQDQGDLFSYSLIGGGGAPDNAAFEIVGNELRTAIAFDADVKNSYTIHVRSTDLGGGTVDQSFVITVTGENSPPTSIALSHNRLPEKEPAGAVIGSLSSSDPDFGDLFTYTLVSGEGAGDNASFTIDGAVLKSALEFDFRLKNSFSIRVRSTDAAGLFIEESFTIQITDVRIDGLAGAAEAQYRENSAPVLVAAMATLSDVERLDFDGGTLTAWFSEGGTPEDRLSIRSVGTAANQISVTDNRIYFTKSISQVLTTFQIGEFTGGEMGLPLTVAFNSTAYRTEVQTALRAVVFDNPSDTPFTGARQVSFVLTDGDGGVSNNAARLINVIAVNDKPLISVTPVSVEYDPSGPAVIIDAGVAVSDSDSPDFADGRLVAKIETAAQITDRLEIAPGGAVTVDALAKTVSFGGAVVGSYAGTTTLTVSLNNLATAAVVQAIARQITYRNLSVSPSTATREISFSVSDGDGATSAEALGDTVEILESNYPPELEISDLVPARYVEDGEPTLIAASAVVADLDARDFHLAMLSVALSENATSADQLSIRHSDPAHRKVSVDAGLRKIFYTTTSAGTYEVGSFEGGENGAQLIITFSENALKNEVQAVLRAIVFASHSDNPSTAPRVVQFTLTDGDGGTSNTVNRTIEIVARNDAPTIANLGDAIDWTRGSAPALISPAASITDPDSSDFVGGKMSIRLVENFQTGDRFEIDDGGGITLSGNVVSYNGNEIGFFAGKATLTVTFTTPNATSEAIEALLRRITFGSTSASVAPRTLRVTLTDGDGGNAAAEKMIHVQNP